MRSPDFLHIIHLKQYKAPGAMQMALDKALCQWVKTQPENTLIWRTYIWEPSCWSLGCHQKVDKILAFNNDQTDVVIRPTGGRAILHGDDVSFAFVSNALWLRQLSVKDSYCVFQTWIRQALETLNVPLSSACKTTGNTTPYQEKALCFETKTTYDLSDDRGTKISGAAQLKTRDAFLQHGVVFIKPFVTDAEQLFESALGQAIAHAMPEVSVITQDWEKTPALSTLLLPVG